MNLSFKCLKNNLIFRLVQISGCVERLLMHKFIPLKRFSRRNMFPQLSVGFNRMCLAAFEHLLAFGETFKQFPRNFWISGQLLTSFVLIYIKKITFGPVYKRHMLLDVVHRSVYFVVTKAFKPQYIPKIYIFEK